MSLLLVAIYVKLLLAITYSYIIDYVFRFLEDNLSIEEKVLLARAASERAEIVSKYDKVCSNLNVAFAT